MSKPPSHPTAPLSISPPLALAPMAGMTQVTFRRMIRSLGGCGLVVTEMVNASACTPRARRAHRLLDLAFDEHPIAAQIAGHDPEQMAYAAGVVQELGFDLVDVNAGCPARRVTGNGGGAALLRDLGRLEAILNAVRRAVTIPVTVKFRSGWDERSIVAREVAALAEACGCAAITLHPRTRAQGYQGRADWGLLREVVAAVRLPVWASGDIHTVADARRCLEETGCAGLMIARGALTNPWIFVQVAAALAGREVPQPTPAERCAFLRQYLDLLEQDLPERAALGKFKFLAGRMSLGLPGQTAFRQQVMRSHTIAQVRRLIADFWGSQGEKTEPLAPDPKVEVSPASGH